MAPWTFVHATDLHIGSPRSFRFQPAWNENWRTARRQIIDIKPDLLLVGGDVARDGTLHRYELEAVKADLDDLPFPCHVVPGNMDTGNKHSDVNSQPREGRATDLELNLRSEQIAQWESVFGPAQWSFVHKDVRFSSFCDMLAGSGLPEEEALWEWMEGQKKQPRARRHVWVMHSAMFVDDLREPNFDITDPKHYHDWYFGIDEPMRSRLLDVFKVTGADVVISGHVHCRRHCVAEGIRFDIGPSTAFSQWGNRWPDGDATLGFLRYDVTDQGIKCAFVSLERVSEAKGYGPGGHPTASQRDYSIAWEK
ncbi:MAG: metallophosphoesterase [Planctomycetota bacterium]